MINYNPISGFNNFILLDHFRLSAKKESPLEILHLAFNAIRYMIREISIVIKV